MAMLWGRAGGAAPRLSPDSSTASPGAMTRQGQDGVLQDCLPCQG